MGMFDSLFGSKNTQTQTQTRDPWAPAQGNLQFGLGQARSLYDQRMQQQFFPGQTYAGFSPESEQAMSGIAGRAQAGSPLVKGAQGMLGSTVGGSYLSAGNPYFQGMADRVTSNVLPSITAQWARAGRGTGNGDVVEAASRGLGDSIGQLAYQNYGQERGNQMQAAGMAPQLANQDYYDLQQLAGVGGQREAMAQKGINEAMQRYEFDQNRGARSLSELMGYTQPIAQMGGTSSGTTESRQSMSPIQGIAGLGMMGAGLYSNGLGFGGMGSSAVPMSMWSLAGPRRQ